MWRIWKNERSVVIVSTRWAFLAADCRRFNAGVPPIPDIKYPTHSWSAEYGNVKLPIIITVENLAPEISCRIQTLKNQDQEKTHPTVSNSGSSTLGCSSSQILTTSSSKLAAIFFNGCNAMGAIFLSSGTAVDAQSSFSPSHTIMPLAREQIYLMNATC
jgi:hypothetical protein